MTDRHTAAGVTFELASNDRQLEQILALQQRNIEGSQEQQTSAGDGFVTVQHSLDLLRAMNDAAAHVIAVADDQVVGYALSMLGRFSDQVPIIKPMFARLQTLRWQDRPITEHSILIMGQVCVDMSHRGSGVFDGLYQHMRSCYHHRFDFLITEIATRNRRSIAAHQRIGFELMERYADNHDEQWDLVAWDWRDFSNGDQ